jgi:programmed cell death protein 5
MDELEELKRKRLEELQKQQEDQSQFQQQVEQLETLVKQRMTKEALQRFGNIKTVHPEKAMQLLVLFWQLIQANQIEKIDDETLKKVLIQINPKKEFNIRK